MKPTLFLALLPFLAPAIHAQTDAQKPLKTIETLPWRSDKWREVPVRTMNDLPGFKVAPLDENLDSYGGREDKKLTATGFFHAQKEGARWWLVDPLGNAFINRGVDTVNTLESPAAQAAFEKKFGDRQKWAAQTVQLLRDNGFNGTACWSDDETLMTAPQRLPYAPRWNFMGTYKNQRKTLSKAPGKSVYPADAIFVFDPEFPAFCDEHAKQIAKWKDDPYLIGHFSDNELPFYKNALDNFLKLDHDDVGYAGVLGWLKQERGNDKIDNLTDEERQKFLAFIGEKYFSIVSKAIKKYDPNHLYLGSRLHGNAMDQPQLMASVGRYVDVVGINYYGQWSPVPERMNQWTSSSGKPFIVTEFYAKGADTGMANTTGAGWTVKTQADRGLFYEQFVLGLLENPGCVGWHWFKYIDNDPAAPGDPSNTDSNKGILSATYQPYQPLLDAMNKVNRRAYHLTDYFLAR